MLKILYLTFAFVSLIKSQNGDELYGKLSDLDINVSGYLPEPEQLVHKLTEDEFEEYLELWLEQQYEKKTRKRRMLIDGCIVPVKNLTDPQPIYLSNGKLTAPKGTTGNLQFDKGEEVFASCPGNNNALTHTSNDHGPSSAQLICQFGTQFTSPDWLSTSTPFSDVLCKSIPHTNEVKSSKCANGDGYTIEVGFKVLRKQYNIFKSCFNARTTESLYSEYELGPENLIHQSKVARPIFQQGAWYPGLNVNSLYTRKSQIKAIESIVGTDLVGVYVNSSYFLSRGHLAAKTDFVLGNAQRATFTFINCAPQWQTFNGGNWNSLEQNLRTKVASAGYKTIVYTGTWGVLTLKDASNVERPIYLRPSDKKLPVPLWYYKVVYEPSTGRAIAFLGLNNPHVTLSEAKSLSFCRDICKDSRFRWLGWKPDNIKLGFALCCDVNDFRRTVNHLPRFSVAGLLF